MKAKPLLNIKSLKEQVYEFLRDAMRRGEILPGSVIDMEETSVRLGVSKTPLRDALLQLEMEDFVTILPRRKVVVNVLRPEDIKNYYEIIGALESTALLQSFDLLGEADLENMGRLNVEMKEAIERDNFDLYYERNLAFHDVFLSRCGNENLLKIINNLKRRLYDFPRQQGFVKEWEQTSIGEHAAFLGLIKSGEKDEAAAHIRDVHWSFALQEKYVLKYYLRASEVLKG
ncbi:MAG: GntR family transcriptional regulator [Candidatus Aminicenantes bacterium]|nr:GntR family transcriptional regulator [Candidatus Aminicenantes bacterium]